MSNLPLSQHTSTVTQSILRAKAIDDLSNGIFGLVVLGFISFPIMPTTALIGVPLLVGFIWAKRQYQLEDQQQANVR